MSEERLKEAWAKVGDELSGLGLKLKLHVESEFSEDRGEAEAALERLADAVGDTVDAVSNAAKDPAVRDDLRQAGTAFADAVSATVDEARNRARKPTDG